MAASPRIVPDMPAETEIRAALHDVLDPEVGVNVVDLGLVYGVVVDDAGVHIALTMTTPSCPLTETLIRDTNDALRRRGVVGPIDVKIVWEPPWSPDRMTDAAKRQLGWKG